LPEDGVTGDAVFDGNLNPVNLVSHDFFGFLIRLLSDVQAFVEGREEWKYMV
jgi:hypothetical protein